MRMEEDKIRKEFISEAEEILDGLSADARALEESRGDPPPPLVHKLFRGMHSLKGLAGIPAECRSPEVTRVLDDGCEFLLRHHVFRRSHDLTKDSKPGWKRFGFPLMYQTDVLEILGLLGRLGKATVGTMSAASMR